MLHKSVGADFYILMHKRNEKRDTWYHLTTDGAAEEFSKKFPKIPEYWRIFVKAYESVYAFILLCAYYMLVFMQTRTHDHTHTHAYTNIDINIYPHTY